ncbi:FxSxx-COOH system tetratricopeptide repeat protein [Streptomyces celluloflavus]|uniref:FxSxx-COOH system tetratricopeptide repeat protein n=1 Tax=Streptomyces celluloflavus TaxID=58344 RepID=UPI0036D812C9
MLYHATPGERTAWPHQVGVLPSQAQSFQRRAEAQQLREAVDSGGTAVLGQVLAGMGGVGKTQLAADYARSTWHDGSLDVLVWVTASTRSAVVSGYAQAGVELCQARPDDSEQAARTFLAWLTPKAGARACRWLIVLDDVADSDDLRGLWPTSSPYGRTLVTTRRRDAALAREGRRLIEVGLFTKAEALTYLTIFLAAHGRQEPAGHLTALARDLGHLPLALSQAAAYLIDSGQDVDAYRELLADRATALADATPDRLPDEQATPLGAAWSLSIDRADQLRPAGLARPMLQLAAMLDPNGIPGSVLTSPPALAYLAASHTREAPEAVGATIGEAEAVGALRALHRLSLIDHTPSNPHQAVRVHQLVQRTVRENLASGQRQPISLVAADALTAVWPEVERDTVLAQILRSNTEILRSHAGSSLWRPYVHPILVRVGQSLGESGQAAAAISYFRRLADNFCHQLGADNAQTLVALSHLAWWQGEAGDPARAAAALASLVPDQERVAGPDHLETFTTRGSLGYWRGQAGDAAGAAATFAELLRDQEQALGSQHPRTLATRHALAHWRARAGDAAGAARELAELLPHQERVLGPDHPETLLTRHDLAHWRGKAAGDAVGAAGELAELLSHQERVLGPHHPRTLLTRSNLANWKGEAGDMTGAIFALTELLADRERILGTDHPRTLFTRSDLARWRACTQEPAMAVDTLFEVLGQLQRVLGPDHPRTLVARGRLACSQGDAGHVDRAVVGLAALLTDQQRVLGPHHPDTVATEGNLLYWRAWQE